MTLIILKTNSTVPMANNYKVCPLNSSQIQGNSQLLVHIGFLLEKMKLGCALFLFVLSVTSCTKDAASTDMTIETPNPDSTTDSSTAQIQVGNPDIVGPNPITPDTEISPITGQNNDNQESLELAEADYPTSRSEMALTWGASMVKLPDGNGGVITTSIDDIADDAVTNGTTLPLVVYMHGCSGFWQGSNTRTDWFAQQGFVTIAPDSFARSFYPDSCNLNTQTGWQYKPTISMRQYDLGYALEQIRNFSWVNQDQIFVYGFSEGGLIAATFNSIEPTHKVLARVIESWSCSTIPWPEYQGITAPVSEPLLTLFADQDPWLQGAPLESSCGDYITVENGSQSFLFDYEPLRSSHLLFDAPEVKELILNFYYNN